MDADRPDRAASLEKAVRSVGDARAFGVVDTASRRPVRYRQRGTWARDAIGAALPRTADAPVDPAENG